MPGYAAEVLTSFLPIAGVFVVFQLISRRCRARQIRQILVGFLYTYVGLVLFLTRRQRGLYHRRAQRWGRRWRRRPWRWLLVPLGMLIGYFIVKAEPAVQVLNQQVQDVTNGAISAGAMDLSLSVGVAVSCGAGHAAGAHRSARPVDPDPGLPHRAGALAAGAAAVRGHCL